MTDQEICSSFRRAENPAEQIKILSQLALKDELEIIAILIAGGIQPAEKTIDKLFRKLDKLEAEISVREREYKNIVAALRGKKEEIKWRQDGTSQMR